MFSRSLTQFSRWLSSNTSVTKPSFTPSSCTREAHTFARQDRGLYNGTHKQFGNSVAESKKKSARVWLPNVHSHTIYSSTLRRKLTLRITASVWRTINNAKYEGSIDNYLTSASRGVQRNLGMRGDQLRREILNVKLKKARISSWGGSKVKAKGQSKSKDSAERGDGEGKAIGGREGETVAAQAVVSPAVNEAAKLEGVAAGM